MRARAIVNAIARNPHPVGSRGHEAIREYLRSELIRLGLTVSEQRSSAAQRYAGSENSAAVRNLLGIIPGIDPGEKALLLAAHYDSASNSRGASDDGAAVAALLETARALKAGPRLRRSVLFLFTDAEEVGLLGALAFVQEHPLARRVGLVMNFEARGTSGPVLMYQTSPNNRDLITSYGRFAPYPHANSLISRLARILPNDTDASIFVRAGYSVLAFAFVEGVEHYHRYTDSLENLDSRSLAHCGAIALSLAREMGQAEHLLKPTSDAVYFTLFGRFLIDYPTLLAKLLGSLVALGWIELVRRELSARRITDSGILRGAKLQVLSVAIALVVPVMLHLLRMLMIDRTCLIRNAAGFGCADCLVVTALNLLFYGSALRQITVRELVLGGLSLSALLSVLLGWVFPDASLPWQWITAISLIVWRLEPSILPHRYLARIAWLHLPLFVAILLFGPIVSSAVAAAGPNLMPIALIMAATTTGLLLPTLLQQEFRQLYLVSGSFGLLGFAAMLAITVYSYASQARNHEDSLIYTVDTAGKTARYASEGLTNDAWVSKFIPQNAVARPLLGFSSTPEPWRQITAPLYPLEAPQVAVRELPSFGPERHVELRISSVKPGCIKLWQTTGPALKTHRVNDKPVEQFVRFSPEFDELGLQLFSGMRFGHRWNHHHCDSGTEPLVIQLLVPRQQSITLRLVEERESFPEPMLRQLSPRPPGFVPSPNSDETWIGQDITL